MMYGIRCIQSMFTERKLPLCSEHRLRELRTKALTRPATINQLSTVLRTVETRKTERVEALVRSFGSTFEGVVEVSHKWCGR